MDVASVTDAERQALGERFGANTFPLVQLMWVADFGTRAEVALGQLFGPGALDGLEPPAFGEGGEDGGGLWSAIDDFLVEVARLDRLDPSPPSWCACAGLGPTTAGCAGRRRLVGAVQAGADEATFDQIDDYERSELDVNATRWRCDSPMPWCGHRARGRPSWPPRCADSSIRTRPSSWCWT